MNFTLQVKKARNLVAWVQTKRKETRTVFLQDQCNLKETVHGLVKPFAQVAMTSSQKDSRKTCEGNLRKI